MIAHELTAKVPRRFPEITAFDRRAQEREALLVKFEAEVKDLKERAKRLA